MERALAMPTALAIFASLREDLTQDALNALSLEVRDHYEHLLREQRRNELVAIDLAELVASRLAQLLRMAHVMTPDARMDVVGAARYFVSSTDAVPDERACTGLDDDVEIFNHVVRTLGRPDLLITE